MGEESTDEEITIKELLFDIQENHCYFSFDYFLDSYAICRSLPFQFLARATWLYASLCLFVSNLTKIFSLENGHSVLRQLECIWV